MGSKYLELDYSVQKIESSIIKWLVISGMPVAFLIFNSLSGYANISISIKESYGNGDILLIFLQFMLIIYMLILGLTWIFCATYENEYFEKWIKIDSIKGNSIFVFVVTGISISSCFGIMAATAVNIKLFLIFYSAYNFLDLIQLIIRKNTISRLFGTNISNIKSEINQTKQKNINTKEVKKELQALAIYCEAHNSFEFFHMKRPLARRVTIQLIFSIILCFYANSQCDFISNPDSFFLSKNEILYIALLLSGLFSELTIRMWRKSFYDQIDKHKSDLHKILNS